MEYITSKGTLIYFDVDEKNCKILNSAAVHTREEKTQFIQFLLDFFPYFNKRTLRSYYLEWKAHNILYRFHILRRCTGITDLEINEPKWRRAGYHVISGLFSDKMPR